VARYISVVVAMATAISLLAQLVSSIRYMVRILTVSHNSTRSFKSHGQTQPEE